MATMKIQSSAGTSPVGIETYDSGGDGRPVVLIHGWPLSGHAWRPQKDVLEQAGYRVIAFDRRGFGDSDKPGEGYDYDTMTADVKAIVDELSLSDAVLVGFSMGGGEVARYVGRYGTGGLSGVVFASAVPPFLLKTDDNPDGGLGDADVQEMKDGLSSDRDGFFSEFSENFFTADGELRVDGGTVENWRALASDASTEAALECIDAFARTDFRDDLAKVDVPTLVIHGAGDEIVPIDVSGKRTAEMVDGATLHVVEGGPHGINDSHTEEFNRVLLEFLGSL
ncbi:alpha/beta fold hydrolase [Ilumatobacter sp.]|uniref:alpha/beta fold hydrolase n=1 Tax=Ilumatobacter sp. TaxID=1967498 RepID=UPI003B521DF0